MRQLGYSLLLVLGLVSLEMSQALTRVRKTEAEEMLEVQKIKEHWLKSDRLSDDPTEAYFDVEIDHFTNNGVSPTYKMRYLMNDKLVDGNDAPILFYCGNEGSVETFYQNSGYITVTLATQMKALVLFAEHRYYGKSKPFGDQSFTPDNVKFLTVDQTMMDYVKFIKNIKS